MRHVVALLFVPTILVASGCTGLLGSFEVAPAGSDGGVADGSASDGASPVDATTADSGDAGEPTTDGAMPDTGTRDAGDSGPGNDASDGAACGAKGAACCTGDKCDGALVCLAGKCTECGTMNTQCCAGGLCLPNLTCGSASGTCECGAPSQPCCATAGTPACAGTNNVCSANSCHHCGDSGEVCCPTPLAACSGNLTCQGGLCGTGGTTCGGDGQSCCTTGTPCGFDLVCGTDSKCKAAPTCGAKNQQCCTPGGTCDSGLACIGNACVDPPPCGNASQACCAGSIPCQSGLTCTGNVCQAPPCGGEGQSCCTTGTACTSTKNVCRAGTCTRCGAIGEVCCSSTSAQCDTGGACSNSACVRCGGNGDICCAAPDAACVPGLACGTGNRCVSSTCSTDLSTDANNCGACGHACEGGTCSGGMCQPQVLGTLEQGLPPGSSIRALVMPSPTAGNRPKTVYVAVDVAGPQTGANGRILSYDIASGSSSVVVANLDRPSSMALDAEAKTLFYGTLGGTLGKHDLTGSSSAPPLAGAPNPIESVAYSVDTNDVFFATANQVRQVPSVGGSVMLFLQTGNMGLVRGTAIADGMLYAADFNGNVTYKQALQNGSRIGVANQGLDHPWRIDAKRVGGSVKLAWTNAGAAGSATGFVHTMDTDLNVSILNSLGSGLAQPESIVIDVDTVADAVRNVFWVNAGGTTLQGCPFAACGSRGPVTYASVQGRPVGLASDDKFLYFGEVQSFGFTGNVTLQLWRVRKPY
ncbi:MAG: hypothetical protein U0169_21940 [Polyangiaceae bacterium]